MRSMTGFGRALIERNGVQVTAEIRALNQRFFELKLNLPRSWGEYEGEIRKLIQGTVARGRVELFVKAISVRPPTARLQVNEKLASQYVDELRKLAKRMRLNGELGIEAILNRPEIFHVVEEERDASEAPKLGLAAIQQALKALDIERVREGKSLKNDFAARVKKVRTAIPKIERMAEQTRAEIMRISRRASASCWRIFR